MSEPTEEHGLFHALVAIAIFGGIAALAAALHESTIAGSIDIGLVLVLLMLAPIICLPAIAFRTQKKSNDVITRLNQDQSLYLSTILENLAQGVCMFDGEKRLILCNARYAEIYGLSPDLTAPGSSFRDILEARIENKMYAGPGKEAYIQERLDAVSERQESRKVHELTDKRFIAIRHVPMPGGGWIATHEDVTELIESRKLFSEVFQTNPAPCAIAAPSTGKHYDVNESWMELLGYTREEALQYDAISLGIWVDTNQRSRFVELVQRHGSYKGFETKFRRKSGDIIDVRVSGVLSDVNGEPQLLVIYDDITARKRAKDELISHRDRLQDLVDSATQDLKNQAKELELALVRERDMNEQQRQFISTASHEFRTPLAIIDAAAQRMKKRQSNMTDDELADRIDKIRRAVRRMMQLMESSLTAARMENGKTDFNPQECHLGTILSDICERQNDLCASKPITLKISGLDAPIMADVSAAEQVFTNLIGNAVKYSRENPDVNVRASTDGDYAVIRVQDNGIGIGEEDLKRVGERFFRAETSMGIAGTGIGLNLVKALIEMHEGSLEIESMVGVGSTFTVKLPVKGPSRLPAEAFGTAVDAA